MSRETGLREGRVLERRKKEDRADKVGPESQAELRVDGAEGYSDYRLVSGRLDRQRSVQDSLTVEATQQAVLEIRIAPGSFLQPEMHLIHNLRHP